MKVNFWQALGVVLIVVGVIFWARSKFGDATVDPAKSNPPAAVTQPATPDAATQGAGDGDAADADGDAGTADAEPATRPAQP